MANTLVFNPFSGVLDYVGAGSSGGTVTGAGTATQVAFWTSGSSIGSDPAFFWDNVNKRFGVGINSGLLARIEVQSLVGEGATLFQGDFYNDGSLAPSPAAVTGALLSGRRSRGTPTVPAAVQPNDQLFNIVASGDAGAGLFSGSRANIILAAGGTAAWNAGSHPTQIDFNTTLEGTTGVSGSPPRLRIAHDGTILVNSTALIAGSRVIVTGGALHVLAGNALRLQGAGAGFSSFVDPTHAANVLYTLPANQGPAGTMLTNVDGAGTLDWRQAPAGLPGEDGIDGDPGPPGVTGATGPQGATGNTGPTGATGMAGLHGFDGIDGDDGMAFPIPGVQGPPGIQGIQGIQGVQGLQGFMGIPGGDGLDGEEGMPMPGIAGPQGPTGLTGIQGVQGPPGMSDDGGGGADEWPSFFGIPTLTGDPFTMYTKLAGRTGTTNDTTLSLDGNGTLAGSAAIGQGLILLGSTNPSTAGGNSFPPVRIGSNVTNIGASLSGVLALDANYIFNNAGGRLYGLEFGSQSGVPSTWTWTASNLNSHFLFLFDPLFTISPAGTSRSIGVFNLLLNQGTTDSLNATVTIGALRLANNAFNTSSSGTGHTVVTEMTDVLSIPNLGVANDQITSRRGLWFQNALGVGRQLTTISLDVEDQTSAVPFTLASAVRSKITDAGNATKMFLQDTGGARSEFAGMFTRYKNVPTQGWGIPGINGYNRTVGATAAVASVATFTVGAADGTFSVSGNVLVTASTSHSFSLQVDYTDEGGTARTATLNVQQLGGTLITTITNLTGAGPYEGIPLHVRAKAATAITVKTTGTFTTVTYNVEGAIVQIA